MRRNKLSLLFLSALTVLTASCSDELIVKLDIADADSYVSIYMPMANSVPNVKNVFITNETQTIDVSAFYGGPKLPQKDVSVEFEVRPDLVDQFNQTNGTNYLPMPEGSYSMPVKTASISSGEQRSETLKVEVTAEGYLAVAKPYLLPISIKGVSGEEPVVESLRTAYFLISGSYLPGQVPRKKVYSFGHPITKPIFCRNQDMVRIDEGDFLQLYRPDEDGVYADPVQIGIGWGGMSIMFYMPDNRFIVRNPWDNLTQYNIDDSYGFGYQRDIGWGWGGITKIFPFKNLAILTVNGDALVKYPLSQSGDFDFANCFNIENTGWGGYTQVFGYGNYLIAIDGVGDMWAIPLSDSYTLGSKRKVGTGWNIYEKVFQCGDDLLAIDAAGDVYRYQFDPTAYWPLASEESTE